MIYSNIPTMLSSQDFENKHSDMLKAARDGKPYVEDDCADIFSFTMLSELNSCGRYRENDVKIGDFVRINLPLDHYRKLDILAKNIHPSWLETTYDIVKEK